MASMTLIAPVAMATTQLARVVRYRVVRYEDASVWESPRVERTPLRMSWVVATDGDGKRKLQIEWLPSVGSRRAVSVP